MTQSYHRRYDWIVGGCLIVTRKSQHQEFRCLNTQPFRHVIALLAPKTAVAIHV